MRELVAIVGPAGPSFVAALTRIWDDGDAALVVDPRLPAPAVMSLLETAAVGAVVDLGTGERRVIAPSAPPVDDGDALVVASSGTTGAPKAIVHTHGSVEAHARAVHARLGVDARADRWLACLPLAHLGGLGVVVRSLVTDTPVDVLDGFDRDVVASAPADLGTTLVSLVPTALDRIDPSGFRWVVLGGAADPVERPGNVVRTYGLTETGGGVVYDGEPLDGVEVRLDEDGSIRLRGPVLARGIRRPDGGVDPVADAEGWLATGDLGRWDPSSRLEVQGRADDLIVTGGENVWPGPVETVLRAHPEVGDVAVVGRPDPEWGQRVVAVVVPTDAAAPPTLDALREAVRARLPAFAAPREVVIVGSLPRTALGKVRRHDLA